MKEKNESNVLNYRADKYLSHGLENRHEKCKKKVDFLIGDWCV